MKKSIFILFWALSFSSNLFSQPVKELPDFIFAENSDFLLLITMLESKKESFVINNYTLVNDSWFGNESFYYRETKGEKPEYEEALINIIKGELERINLKPKHSLAIYEQEVTTPEGSYEFGNTVMELNPKFILEVLIQNPSKIIKAYKKGKLSLEKITGAGIVITKPNPDKFKTPLWTSKNHPSFYVNYMGQPFVKVMDKFEKAISNKDSTSFSKSMDANEDYKKEAKEYNKLLETVYLGSKKIEDWPEEKDLSEQTISIVHPHNMSITVQDPKDIQKKMPGYSYKKQIEELYKYNCKIVGIMDLVDNPTTKYAIIPRYRTYVKTYSKYKSDGTSKRYIGCVPLYYYAIKNMETNEIYVGPNFERAEVVDARETVRLALRILFLGIGQKYGWEMDKKK